METVEDGVPVGMIECTLDVERGRHYDEVGSIYIPIELEDNMIDCLCA